MLQRKQCNYCKETKEVSHFAKKSGNKDGLDCKCRDCHRAYMAKWRSENRDRDNASKKRWAKDNPDKNARLKRANRYGMRMAELDQFLADNPDCAICGDAGEHVDHCHTTGKVRGHLCGPCNKGLGHFKDNVKSLREAAAYLERNAA